MTAESESSKGSVRPALPGARWALALGGGLLAGFFIIVVCGSIDRGRRAALETVSQVTAVEDRTFYAIPAKGAEGVAPAGRLGERALFLASRDTVRLHDSDVRRVATDPATGLTVYESEDPKILPAKERGNTYLLKVATDRFVKVRVGGK